MSTLTIRFHYLKVDLCESIVKLDDKLHVYIIIIKLETLTNSETLNNIHGTCLTVVCT